MARGTVTVSGNTGYRHQLDRARRFHDRIQRWHDDMDEIDEVQFQDDMWSFFQHCWHIKDWLANDPVVSQALKATVIAEVHRSQALRICQDLCNGTKHLSLKTPRSGAGARHKHVETLIAPEQGRYEIDVVFDDGSGGTRSGKELARECIAEWERILTAHGLATERRS